MNAPAGPLPEQPLHFHRPPGKIHAKAIAGRFNRWRWGMVWLTQAIFYGACWLPWESDGQPRQAILFDIAHERLYCFGLVLWPQDALLLTCLLVGAAAALFLVTALAGRLFCGFACPQTVYTAIFTWIEARVEGDHLARRKLAAAPFDRRKLALAVVKHGLWALVALWTGITFVGYFTPIRELLPAIGALATGPWECFWLLFYALFTYVQAGLAREAVCQHMCPYSRFQGVMFDPATRNVAYDHQRGEPRRPRGPTGQAGAHGDCIDCGICVQVCPTGIDIRDGLQYQCINCGLCIDACDTVMARLALPAGLIRFASDNELAGVPAPTKMLQRPRVAVYAGLLLIFGGLAGWHLMHRPLLLVDVLRDRGALLRETPEGMIENAYTLKLMNLDARPHRYRISVAGPVGAQLVGAEHHTADPGSIRPLALTVAVPAGSAPSGSQEMRFIVEAEDAPRQYAEERSRFLMP